MRTNGNGRSSTDQRPMEWMRFDPVKFGLLVDGESFEVEGAFARIIRHLWNRGPLPEADVRRILKGNFEVVRTAMFEVDGNLSLELVEDARAHGQRRINQRVEAGIASAAKRNDRSTKMNDRSTDVLSMSMSSSESTQEKKERTDARDPEVQEVIDYLLQKFKPFNVAKLDPDPVTVRGKTMDGNRLHAATLLKNMRTAYPGFKPMIGAKKLIDIALADDFERSNCTKVHYLVKHMSRIIAKAPKSKPEPVSNIKPWIQ